MKLNVTEQSVIIYLPKPADEGLAWSIDNLAIDLQIKRVAALRAVRGLRRKGLAELSPLFDDDGLIRGSGYTLTLAGVAKQLEVLKMEGKP